MKYIRKQGFTIVELVIVIAVIAILTVITGVMYTKIQGQARNTQLRDAAAKVVDAIQLFKSKYGHMPRGGSGATATIGSGTECADGVNGWFAKGTYGTGGCTVEDTLVASGYLPVGFSSKLPKNTLYNPSSSVNLAMMVYKSGGSDKVMVYYTMEDATSDDVARLNAELTKCGYSIGGSIPPRDSYGMRGGICADL